RSPRRAVQKSAANVLTDFVQIFPEFDLSHHDSPLFETTPRALAFGTTEPMHVMCQRRELGQHRHYMAGMNRFVMPGRLSRQRESSRPNQCVPKTPNSWSRPHTRSAGWTRYQCFNKGMKE